jgi:TP901 family phage tail tape measure protein
MGKDVKFDIKAQNKTKAAFTSVEKSLSGLKTGLGAITKIAGGVAVAGGAVAAGVGAGIKTSLTHFAKYETALVDMGKVTNESLSSIQSKIRDIPPELGNSTELVKGYYQTISAGVTDPVKAMDVLTTSARAAGAAHMEQSEVIKGITALMAGYGSEMTSATEAGDLLFTMEARGKTEFQLLIPVIGGLAAMSHNLGIKANELGGAFSTVTLQAGSTEQAATQVQAVLTGLSKPTTTMTEALNLMGYESAQAAIQNIGLNETLQGLIAYTGGSAVEMNKLFGRVEAVKGVTALAGQGFETLTGNIEAMTEKTGGVERAWKAYARTLSAVWKTFKNSVMNQVILLGQQLAPHIKKVVNAVSGWIAENRALIRTGIVEFVRGFGHVLAVAYPYLREVWFYAKNLIGPIDRLGVRFKKLSSILRIALGYLKSVAFVMEKIYNLYGGVASIISSVSSVAHSISGKFQTGTGLAGLPETGLYYGHKGEIVIDPTASAAIRATSRLTNPRIKNMDSIMSRQSASPQVNNKTNNYNYYVTVSPTYMTGDRNAARAVASEIDREIKRKNIRWGTA